MKKWLSVLLVLLLLCSLCGVTAMAEDAEELPGVFAMVKMVSDEDGDMTDQLKALVALGMAPTLTIEEDGSAELDLFGETETIKFDFDAGTVDVGNDVVVPYTWEDEVLSFGGDGILFAFSKNASADVEKGVGRILADGKPVDRIPVYTEGIHTIEVELSGEERDRK